MIHATSEQYLLNRESSGRSCSSLLDEVREDLISVASVSDVLWKLIAGLQILRSECRPEEWRRCVELCEKHPIRELLHQDPYTSRSYNRPRGYPGDAVLIDYLYFTQPLDCERADVSELGMLIFDTAVRTPSTFSVRRRRDFATHAIDSIITEHTIRPAVLSLACGHLREATHSQAIRQGLLSRFVAVDQDGESIRIVTDEWAGRGIDARCVSAAEVIRAPKQIGKFDLVYALGLYDYLRTESARTLTRHLFDLLTPGGKLLIANFVPGILEAGYMEGFMRWNLVYRTPTDLLSLCEVLPQNDVDSTDVILDDYGNIAYLSVVRR
jgi:extracellular factor (EF) 3-hydroxypalmitic acid methyl ester biosynthesis protein